MKYKLEPGAKVYRAASANLSVTPDLADDRPVALDEGAGGGSGGNGGKSKPGPGAGGATPVHDPDAVIVYTDGACTGNPGPMGIGVVVLADGKRREIGEFLGHGTNNIAELTAIERGLEAVEEMGNGVRDRTVLVHSDSSYAIGLLSQGWKAKANTELVERIRVRTRRFSKLRFVKVLGHSGVPENERCDQLATGAVAGRR